MNKQLRPFKVTALRIGMALTIATIGAFITTHTDFDADFLAGFYTCLAFAFRPYAITEADHGTR
jgi:hypothetical protein